ncbi:MAG TPA: phosphoribosylaminoimidazolesuccinocarboxamide synthase [Elusimicrobiota bacterium]|nr:phosphoribosylaminoimidazolesuccinocarboxamide synthase [Elusimicrobiota bacterium]
MAKTIQSSDIGLPLKARGKVRDIYELGDKLLLVATDRLSAFDHILPTPIPEKGKLLTQVSAFWFKKTAELVPNHLISADLAEIRRLVPQAKLPDELYDGRVMLCKKAKRVDAECVARGYLVGSGWKDYQKTGAVCGHALPKGLQLASRLPQPIFTPATKADTGHDENISREQLAKMVGADVAAELERLTLKIYAEAAAHMEARGIILADTKFEFGFIDGKLCIIDEMLTPDSSRFWDKAAYKVGVSPESFDKQFVRDYLEKIGWDKNPPVPPLPDDVARGTTERYREAFRRITA